LFSRENFFFRELSMPRLIDNLIHPNGSSVLYLGCEKAADQAVEVELALPQSVAKALLSSEEPV
jgi:hypothetical protein